MLQLLGWNTRTFGSGEKFLGEATAEGERCLVVDFNLGTMTAVEVIRRIREVRAGFPAIVVSSEPPEPRELDSEFRNY